MREHFYTIHPEIFCLYPGYVRGVVMFHEVHNNASPSDLVNLLRQAEEFIRNRMNLESLSSEECIASWREAFRKFGTKPGEYRSSIEAMIRRVLRGDNLPSINALVDIGNIISLKYLVPVGGHAIDQLYEDLSLCVATGEEEFTPFGTDKPEHPEKGEVIFADGNIVVTRRWTWRQGNHTLTLPRTSAIEYNVDGLPPVGLQQVEVLIWLIWLVGFARGASGWKYSLKLIPGFH
jgi:DNA/RNA-binding domain of Phe-tRNA-synthetase-like protein